MKASRQAIPWLIALFVLLGLARAPVAQADLESWLAVDTRMPLSPQHDLVPDQLRVFSIAQLGLRYPGTGLMLFGVGPVWDVNAWLQMALSADLASIKTAKGFIPEYRFDVEPTVRGNWGLIGWSDRNRLELRMRPEQTSVRYRNQMRLSFNLEGAYRPYLFNEVFFEFPGPGFNQNRTVLGTGIVADGNTRLDVGYMWRWRYEGTTWNQDHILMLFVFFTPRVAPLWNEPGAF
ncbi:MAG: DUF2490 domain-containing protein [Candidatus Sericytochromatia bacterium]